MINAGDTAWVMVSIALVLLMTPGLAFFYGGLVRHTEVVNTLKMSFIAMAVIALEWALFGYSFAFSPNNSIIGGFNWIGLNGVGMEPNVEYAATIPHYAFMMFQMMFAVITPALISGAIVGRMKFRAYLPFILLWTMVVYNPLAHWVWGVGGWLRDLGALDFAGGSVVHISAGVSALVAAMILGPRSEDIHIEESTPHNIPLVILGASLLWFGWFGFNAGSALTAGGLATLAALTTTLSAAAATLVWIVIEMLSKGKPSSVGAAIGAVVGLVAITPAAGFVTPLSAIAIGAIASCISFLVLKLLNRTSIDDTLDVFACHGVGGITGALLTGVFATTTVNPAGADGLIYGNVDLIWAQFASIGAASLIAVIGTSAIMFVLKLTVGLRPAQHQLERNKGIDLLEHGEEAYTLEAFFTTGRFFTNRNSSGSIHLSQDITLTQ